MPSPTGLDRPDTRTSASPRLTAAVLEGLPTPAYVYDLAEIRRNAVALRAELPAGAVLYYSLKANPHPAVLAELRAAGARAEICSDGELTAALAAGFDPADVLVTGPGKRDADVARALRAGVRDFSVDSPVGLAQLDREAAAAGVTVRCLLRVNDEHPAAGQGLAMTGVASPFGADAGWVLAEPARFTGTARAPVVGLHLYMGTNLTAVGDLLGQFERSLRTAARVSAALAAHGADVRLVDLGGGFGAPFARAGGRVPLDGLRAGLDELLHRELPGGATVAFESGRYLVGTAGTLLTRVLDVKRSHGTDVVVLESGVNHLGGMSGLRRLPPLTPALVTGTDRPNRLSALVTGPLCTPLDVWSRSAALPDLDVDELLAVPNVGAYGLYASLLGFLGHPLPAEVVLDTDDADPVREVSRLELVRRPVPAP